MLPPRPPLSRPPHRAAPEATPSPPPAPHIHRELPGQKEESRGPPGSPPPAHDPTPPAVPPSPRLRDTRPPHEAQPAVEPLQSERRLLRALPKRAGWNE